MKLEDVSLPSYWVDGSVPLSPGRGADLIRHVGSLLSARPLLQFLESFWTGRMEVAESEEPDFKTHVLPLARIKKVMKSDEDVQVRSLSSSIAACLFCLSRPRSSS
jgi:hypothetical protein